MSILKLFLKKHAPDFHAVVPFEKDKDTLLAFDFTATNESLAADILNDVGAFTNWVNTRIKDAGARYGIGGYAEHRIIYSVSPVFDSSADQGEPRRVHLGTDIWGSPYTKVMAPYDGIVHSYAFNNQFGDYGATIILTHLIAGRTFHTLYGHLSLNAIKNLNEGDRIQKGDVFADFGIPSENGGWPPHLHFQIIEDMQHWAGDYPGVCKFSEKESWLANSPDADLILQMNQYAKE